MKHLTITFLLFLFFLSTNAQEEDDTEFFFNSLSISLNRTDVANENLENRYGYGLGVYRVMREHQRINFIFGIEFNVTRHYAETVYAGHYAHASEVEYTLHNLSIPLNVRLNFGNKIEFFIEAGTFADFVVGSRSKGTMHTYLPEKNSHVAHSESQFNGKADFTSDYNFGLSGGLGIGIPIEEEEINIKTDYKLGLSELSDMDSSFHNRYFRLVLGLGF